MICGTCRDGGEFNTDANQLDVGAAKYLLHLVRTAHRKCRGGTWCDCQHVTGKVVQVEYAEPAGDAG